MPHQLLRAADAFWRPSNQMGVENTDLAKQLGAENLGMRLWRLAPGQASTKHRHFEQEELYLLLEGTGRVRVDDELLTLAPLDALRVGPDSTRQVFNDTDADAPGQEQAPAALREAGLVEALAAAGLEVDDRGDRDVWRWRPDREGPRAQHAALVAAIVRETAERVRAGFLSDSERNPAQPVTLVLGGDCTVGVGTVAGQLGEAHAGDVGPLYFDTYADLNVPEAVREGALDWMGMAHMLAKPGARPELVWVGPRAPLLRDEQVLLFGRGPEQATAFERAAIERWSRGRRGPRRAGCLAAAPGFEAGDHLFQPRLACSLDRAHGAANLQHGIATIGRWRAAAKTASPSRAAPGAGCSRSRSPARGWPSSTARWSTSRCPTSAATSTRRPARCSGSSTATCSPSPR